MGRESRVARLRDPHLLTKIDRTIGVINAELAHVQTALICHAQDGHPDTDAAGDDDRVGRGRAQGDTGGGIEP
jgi:hypothetical protein